MLTPCLKGPRRRASLREPACAKTARAPTRLGAAAWSVDRTGREARLARAPQGGAARQTSPARSAPSASIATGPARPSECAGGRAWLAWIDTRRPCSIQRAAHVSDVDPPVHDLERDLELRGGVHKALVQLRLQRPAKQNSPISLTERPMSPKIVSHSRSCLCIEPRSTLFVTAALHSLCHGCAHQLGLLLRLGALGDVQVQFGATWVHGKRGNGRVGGLLEYTGGPGL